jgi:hypothetical protein
MSPGGDFPPATLRDYALIADGERGALCGPHASSAATCRKPSSMRCCSKQRSGSPTDPPLFHRVAWVYLDSASTICRRTDAALTTDPA